MDSSSASQKPDKPSKWYYGILPVLIALFFVLGPLAFPLLWKSPNFSRLWKILLTVFVIAATIYMIWGSWEIVKIILGMTGH